MARIRKLLSIDPGIEAHRKALEILEYHGSSSDFIVECILEHAERGKNNSLSRAELHQELESFFRKLPMCETDEIRQQEKENCKNKTDVSKIPAAMFDLMKQI